jgi:holo-[acyl-carrier protein] synthase
LGIGIDIVEIGRIEKLEERFGEKGLLRFMSRGELERFQRKESKAGVFAVKEAFSKAVGTGIGSQVGFRDIELVKLPSGKPLLKISPTIRQKFGIKGVEVSISHAAGVAVAVVVVMF